MRYKVGIEGNEHTVDLQLAHPNEAQAGVSQWRCQIDGREMQVDAHPGAPGTVSMLVAGRSYEIRRDGDYIVVNGSRYRSAVRDPRQRRMAGGAAGAAGEVKLLAPMPGKIVTLLVTENDTVAAGQGLMVIEAMKMQNELKSPKQGKVKKLLAAEGSPVNTGDVLAIVE